MSFLLKKILNSGIRKRIFIERLAEPLHLNLISFFVLLFGNIENKIKYDLIVRQHHAYCLLEAAKAAKKMGLKKIVVIEFGVASGGGLLNIIKITDKIEKYLGIKFQIFGMDTGKGMPKPINYKDHPEYYSEGDFQMNLEALKDKLPKNVELIIGDVKDTKQILINKISPESPIGFISFDLDYYSSTLDALEVLKLSNPGNFLPLTHLYFDDIYSPNHSVFSGVLLAIKEFNQKNQMRKIANNRFLVNTRIFTRARWIKQVYYLHVFDHEIRSEIKVNSKKRVISNPYLSFENNNDFFDV